MRGSEGLCRGWGPRGPLWAAVAQRWLSLREQLCAHWPPCPHLCCYGSLLSLSLQGGDCGSPALTPCPGPPERAGLGPRPQHEVSATEETQAPVPTSHLGPRGPAGPQLRPPCSGSLGGKEQVLCRGPRPRAAHLHRVHVELLTPDAQLPLFLRQAAGDRRGNRQLRTRAPRSPRGSQDSLLGGCWTWGPQHPAGSREGEKCRGGPLSTALSPQHGPQPVFGHVTSVLLLLEAPGVCGRI